MDRKAWIAIILSAAGLVAMQFYYARSVAKRTPPPAAQTVATPTPAPQTAPTAPSEVTTPATAPAQPAIAAHEESLLSENAEYFFANDKGGIVRAELRAHRAENDQRVALNLGSPTLIGALGDKPGEAWGGFSMQTDPAKGTATFTRRDADGLEITKRFTLPQSGGKEGAFALQMDVEFKNTGTADVTRPAYFVSTGGAAPIHAHDLPIYTKFDWLHEGKFTSIDVNWFDARSIPLIGIPLSAAQSLYVQTKPGVSWAGVASQYFCTIVTSQKTPGQGVWAMRYDTRKANSASVYGIEGALGMPGFTVPPEKTVSESFVIFAGPKELDQLRKLKNGQDAAMSFGMFGFVSEFLLWAMNGLNGIFNSYAASIIVLTLLIKSALWPVQNKATGEMRKMAALSPKITELREKFADDPQKMNEEMMKLYREYGVNPLSGCLPMLIQIPIFFGFYAMLGSAIELRNSSFFWIHDLSQPDTLTHILGFPINILPLIMAGTMVWQMAISPKSGDAMQQRIFYFMPVIFLVFCYNYASALALYWTTQNLFSIVQLYLTRNKPLPELEKKSVIAKREAAATKKKKKRPGS